MVGVSFCAAWLATRSRLSRCDQSAPPVPDIVKNAAFACGDATVGNRYGEAWRNADDEAREWLLYRLRTQPDEAARTVEGWVRAYLAAEEKKAAAAPGDYSP